MEYPKTEKALEMVFKSARREMEDAALLNKFLEKCLEVEGILTNGQREKPPTKIKVSR